MRTDRRLTTLQVVTVTMIAVLLCRLWYLQVPEGAAASQAESSASTSTVSLPATRGRILDRHGRALMTNVSSVVVTIDRQQLLELDERTRNRVLDDLGHLLHRDPDALNAQTIPCGLPGAPASPRCWNGVPYQPVPVAWDVQPDVILPLTERPRDFPSVGVETRPVRSAPRHDGVNAAQLLGYLAPATEEEVAEADLEPFDVVGRSGLERTYDKALRGEHGVRRLELDALGRVTRTVDETQPTPGNDVVTSIDARIQAVVERELRAAIRRARGTVDRVTGRPYVADSGSAVVLEADTGRVVAMASTPTYDPNIWREGLSESERDELFGSNSQAPLLFRATQGEYAPGSTFKPVTAAAALRSGYGPWSVLPCPGTMLIGDRVFRNFDSIGYGDLSFDDALAVSCDTFFYRIGIDLWQRAGDVDGIRKLAREFGFGRPTGVDLPGESSAGLPERPAYAGDAALVGIGQADVTTTPLQLAVAYGAIANGGTLWQPRIGKRIVGPDGSVVRDIPREPAGRVASSPADLRLLRSALRQTTRSGTGAFPFEGFPLDRFPIASKTGTAEVAGKQTTSWFASFDEKYVVVMTVTQGGTGSGTSGPSVRQIWEALYGIGDDPR